MKKTHLALIAFVNLIFYLPIIFSSLKFYDDDFIIFAYINNNPSSPVITDPSAQYFLFMRPLSYFSFWIDYTLFADNYIALKFINLLIHIFFIVVLYLTLSQISKKFNLPADPKIILLLCLIISIHLDSLLWISFICNRTEQLMILFYALSLFYFLKYIEMSKRSYLILSCLYFLLSVLSKQTGLHLPLIFLLFIYYLYYTKKTIWLFNKELTRFFIFAFAIIFLSSILNLYLYKNQVSLPENLWKKPLTIFSIIIHTIIPLYSNYIHNFFILNKIYAIILFFLACSIIYLSILFVKKRYKISNEKILLLIALCILIFIPRVFAIGSQRLNGVILVWFSILFLFINKVINSKKIIYSFLTISFLFNLFSFYVRANDLIVGDKYKEQNFSDLVQHLKTNSGKTLILCSDTYDVLPYKYYYYTQNEFGKFNRLFTVPIFYEPILVNHDLSFYKKRFLIIEKKLDKFILTTIDPLIYLLIYDNDENIDRIRIHKKETSESGRGFKKIVFSITPEFQKQFENIIYFDGLDWVDIK